MPAARSAHACGQGAQGGPGLAGDLRGSDAAAEAADDRVHGCRSGSTARGCR
jgi:hypothetical protein